MAKMFRHIYSVLLPDNIAVSIYDAEDYVTQNFLHYLDIHPRNIDSMRANYMLEGVYDEDDAFIVRFHTIKDLCGECIDLDEPFDPNHECMTHTQEVRVEYTSIEYAS